MLRVYLDNCVFNRPFDDQSQIRIKLETEAKFYIQDRIKSNNFVLVWSYIIELENTQNPFEERRQAVDQWQALAQMDINESVTVLEEANSIKALGLKSKDALHVACAIEARADYFITTDDTIIKKLADYSKLKIVDPITFIDSIEVRQ